MRGSSRAVPRPPARPHPAAPGRPGRRVSRCARGRGLSRRRADRRPEPPPAGQPPSSRRAPSSPQRQPRPRPHPRGGPRPGPARPRPPAAPRPARRAGRPRAGLADAGRPPGAVPSRRQARPRSLVSGGVRPRRPDRRAGWSRARPPHLGASRAGGTDPGRRGVVLLRRPALTLGLVGWSGLGGRGGRRVVGHHAPSAAARSRKPPSASLQARGRRGPTPPHQ